jgi:hypothetical protein
MVVGAVLRRAQKGGMALARHVNVGANPTGGTFFLERRMSKHPSTAPIHNLVAIADTHCGCALGLLPPAGARLDDGGVYRPSRLQRQIWALWQEFWAWVPEATKGQPFAVVHLGDAIDGTHHNASTQISHNLTIQAAIALDVLRPVVELCEHRYFHLRGTEAHVGASGQEEERLARELGAIPNRSGQHARNELYKTVGPRLVHCLHHIGTTGASHYETTAIHKEYVEGLVESGRWRRRIIDVQLRAHRHRYAETKMATTNGTGFSIVAPGWQGKTPYTFRLPGARQSEPQFGGVLIRWSAENDDLFVREWVRSLTPEQPE